MSDNPIKKIYISYAHKGKGKDVTESLDKAFQDRGVLILRDIREVDYKESFEIYMNQLGAGDYIVAVIDTHYLASHNCMYELLEVHKNKQFRERIFPVVLPCAKINTGLQRLEYIKHWENKEKELKEAMSDVDPANLQGIREELDLYTEIRSRFATITNILSDMNFRELASHQEEDFNTIFEAIHQKTHQEKEQKPKPKQSSITTNKSIPVEKIYNCDRIEQTKTFVNVLQEQKKINTFYIHGDEMHGHEAMFHRFCKDLRGTHGKKIKKITGGLSDFVAPDFRERLVGSLLHTFNIDLDQYPPGTMKKEKLLNVYKSSGFTQTLKAGDIVAVNFTIRSSKWVPGLADEIEWLVRNFCDEEMLPDDAPTFYFFFSVVYRSKVSNIPIRKVKRSFLTSLFDRKKAKQQKERIRKIEQLKQKKQGIIEELTQTFITRINELTWVKSDDVEEWLFGIDINPYERERLMMTKFKTENPQGYYMSELTPTFKKIIEQINSKL